MAPGLDYESKPAQNGSKVNGHQSQPAQPEQSGAYSRPPGQDESSDGSLFGNYMKLRRASRRPLPTDTGDGTYRQIVKRPGLSQDLRSLSIADVKTLLAIISSKIKGETQMDDKKMLMEKTIQLVAGLPDHSRTQETLTNTFIGQLWDSLDHPPLLYMGEEYKYRRPDGSFNNPHMPQLGAAGTRYSRTCKPRTRQLGAQPDPETIFESIMARGTFKRNPNNVSSILWYWATIVIHDLFNTNLKDGNQNDSSSYLDLSPLYGATQEAQDSIRTFKDGMLKPDAFADMRLNGNPPGVCILLIMFNRFHNNVAKTLADVNEGNRFPKPTANMPEEAAAAVWKKYDEELFQTARLVTSGLYINITLIDYVRNIVNLNRVDSAWTLDPRQEMGTDVGTKKGSESGVGNTVSAEFNLCYRWHSCISEMDDKWIQDFYVELLGENYGDMNLQTVMMAFKKFEMTMPKDPGERHLGNFKRGPDGKFSDDDLVNALATAIEQPGGAFGAGNVPRIMKPIEIMGILRGRKWNLASLNEFRKHFGMNAYKTFEDINSDPAVADQLRHLYQHPDFVELYPGIVAEEAKTPMVPGVGIAPTYTISRVVLSDAVSLVRGDRYYTTDYHPGNLTNWGYNEVDYDLNVNHGCSFFKLFLRAFPNHFKSDSVYAHYPMVIPSENRKILTNLKRAHLFSFDRPESNAPRVDVTSYGGAKHVLNNQTAYPANWQRGLSSLRGDGGSNLKLSQDAARLKLVGDLLYKDGWKRPVKSAYSAIANELLAEKSYRLAGKIQVDVVRDVGNLAHTHFAARMFNFPLKTKQNPRGVISEQELYQALATIFICIFFDVDPVKSYPLRQKAKEITAQLGRAVETNVKLCLSLGLRGLFTAKIKDDTLESYGTNLTKALGKTGMSAHDITWSQILPAAGAMVPTQGQVFAQALDWYLSPAGDQYRPEIHRIAALESNDESDSLLLGYAMEGVRMAGTFGLYREAATADTIIEDDGRQVNVRPGDRVFVSFVSAAKDPAHFPNPSAIDPRRPLDAYIHSGAGPHATLGRDISQVGLTELFRAVFRKKGLRRAAGPQGELKKVGQSGGVFAYMTEDWGDLSPFPMSMKVTWDEA